MKKRCILIGIGLFITAIGITCLILSIPFYELIIKYIQNESGSFKELMKNSVGIINSLILGLTFIWTMVSMLIKGERRYLKTDEKKTLIGGFFKINAIPILMIIFSVICFEKCFVLSILCSTIIAVYSTALILVWLSFTWGILCIKIKESN